MFLSLLGLILLIAPFSLLCFFKNKLSGFTIITTLIIATHLLIGLLTQGLHIFYYPIILSLHLLSSFIIALILIKKRRQLNFKFSLAPFVILAFILIFFKLWSVHNYYSGEISTIVKPITVTHAKLPYPFFSDEWVGVSLINYSLENNTLPNGNPLINGDHYNHFSNLLVAFFSITAELMMLLQLTPLTTYAYFSLISGLLICYLVYLLLKANQTTVTAALIGALTIPLITNGSNLPGIWYYIPFVLGIITFLLSLIAASLKNYYFYLINIFLTIIFYPPLAVLLFASLIALFFSKQTINLNKKLIWIFGGGVSILGAALIIILLQDTNWLIIKSLIENSIFRSSLDKGLINISPENILPPVIIGLSVLGIFYILKLKKFFLLFPLLVGLFFWTIYSYTYNFFIIGVERVVTITAILLVIAAAFGSDYLLQKIPEKLLGIRKNKIYLIIKISLIVLFSFIALTYTSRNDWKKLELKTNINGFENSFLPSAPATQYLNEEDLQLFSSLKKERFLSLPWKGLAVGAATGNYPLHSKPSFISNRFVNYIDFIRADCQGKNNFAHHQAINYIYLPSFDCPLFKKIGSSSENLNLYKFTPETAFSE